MRKSAPRKRPNQKARRKPHREVGIFTKHGVIRVCEIHPTKGFREQNGEGWRKDFEKADAEDKSIVLSRGKTRQIIVSPVSQVKSNAPKIRHNKSG